MEAEEEFDLTGAVDRIDEMNGGRAVWALQWIGAPDRLHTCSALNALPKNQIRLGYLGWLVSF
jgi:hypothetical protein